jgi:hypothetical protein
MRVAYQALPPEKRPQDRTLDGRGWKFETLEHGGEYPDADPQGRPMVYMPIKVDGKVVDSAGRPY